MHEVSRGVSKAQLTRVALQS